MSAVSTTSRPTVSRTAAAPAPPPVTPVDVVGCTVFSTAGQGLDPIADALLRGTAAEGGPAGEAAAGDYPPGLDVRSVPGFSPADTLGRKGLGRLTRTDQLVSVACSLALGELPEQAAQTEPADTGIVLGTSVGSTGRVGEFIRDTFVQELPYFVNPSHFPGILMNSAAGRAAIRLGLTGVNSTVSGGPLAGLHALRFARTALLAGHARRLLTGAFEELSAQRAWAWHRSGGTAAGVPLGEGGAVFVLQAPDEHAEGPRPLARLLACDVGFADPADGLPGVSRRLADCVRTALVRSEIAPEDVAVAAPGASGRRGWARVEEAALREVFSPAQGPRRLAVQQVLGETDSANGALQLAAVLARWQDGRQDTGRERAAVITSVGPDGSVGCAVVARPSGAPSPRR
ncbi:beta-ketoacyl synthase N-terminal-like domain-containing protein [Streptomyces cinerochromogenes]|uniref:beta-ketoacyl synthase N-terminal-like domain-containing protein n=1 Tax=Streptomyces cinerochromogenes TaxID=66422 RepID=UPI001670EBFD|nr:beta-ketoacyl synthase N-terminal-like domain-containing protein [Streptomyces cinerochromogenes]